MVSEPEPGATCFLSGRCQAPPSLAGTKREVAGVTHEGRSRTQRGDGTGDGARDGPRPAPPPHPGEGCHGEESALSSTAFSHQRRRKRRRRRGAWAPFSCRALHGTPAHRAGTQRGRTALHPFLTEREQQGAKSQTRGTSGGAATRQQRKMQRTLLWWSCA